MAEFLSRRGVEFVKRNIREDAEALDELLRGGFRATPVTIIDGQSVVGYNEKALTRLIES